MADWYNLLNDKSRQLPAIVVAVVEMWIPFLESNSCLAYCPVFGVHYNHSVLVHI